MTTGMQAMGLMSLSSGPRDLLNSPRRAELDYRLSFFECTQHQHKKYDFDGRIVSESTDGKLATQPLIQAAYYVPLRMRRPSSPYRLPRVIVTSFTTMMFGERRFPELKVARDTNSQDFAQALSKAANFPARMIRARNYGGATGTAAWSWAYQNGKPRIKVHNPVNLFVHSWKDREELIPEHASECYRFEQDEWDDTRKQFVSVTYWYRRDWTPDEDLVFLPARYVPGKPPQWTIDLSKSFRHGDGECHLVWAQNLPSDDIDGEPDYEGLYDNFDALDIMASVIVRGAVLNLDPTVVLNLDPDMVRRMGISKGSDNAIVAGKDGDAKYMELAGTSITAGIALFNEKRKTALEVAQCVIPDPDKIASGQGNSSLTMKIVYQPMLGKLDALCDQYTPPMMRTLEGLLRVAQRATKVTFLMFAPDGSSREVRQEVVLPPKMVKGPAGASIPVDLNPGQGEEIEATWPDYFPKTPTDQQAVVTTLVAATGNKAFMSVKTATQIAATTFGLDPDDEQAQMDAEQSANDAREGQMFGAGVMGGQVTHTKPTAGGGKMTVKSIPSSSSSSSSSDSASDDTNAMPSESSDEGLPIGPADARNIITVNEARKSMGLDELPGDDPEGGMTLAAYAARFAKPIAAGAAANQGKVLSASPAPGAGGPPGTPGAAPHPASPPAPPGAPKPPAPPGAAPPTPTPPQGPPKPPGGGFPPGA